MKTTALILFLSAFGLWAQTPPIPNTNDTSARDQQLRAALLREIAGQTNPAVKLMTAPEPTLQPIPATNTVPTHGKSAPITIPMQVPTLAQPPAAFLPAPAASTSQQGPPVLPAEASGRPETANPPGIGPRRIPPVTPPPTEEMPKPEEVIPTGQFNFTGATLDQILDIYAEMVDRTILRAPNLPSPNIVLKSQTPLTKSEAIEALNAVLALNGVAMINIGDKFVKALPVADAEKSGETISEKDSQELPDLGGYITHIVQLKYSKPSEVVPVLQAFSNTKSILPVDSSGIIVIRDYSENVKRMLEMIKEIDVTVPSDIISEVIPIKYALVDDIQSALSSVSGQGGGGTTVGTRSQPGSHLAGTGNGLATHTGYGSSTTPGSLGTGAPGSTSAGTPSSTSSFSDRLQAIIKRASSPSGSGGDFQILGQTKIIADERTNSLLVFATRQDMDMIKAIIAKLDVVLAQVLIEAIIMEVSLDNNLQFGLSYLQHPQQVGSFTGVGGVLNNSSFLTPGNFAANAANAATNGAASLSQGFSYFARLDNDLDVTMEALATDGRVNVLSRPSIQTSHAVPASLFIGNTVPYITGTTYGSFSGASSSSVYEERQVGISLDVLPLINPDGLVVMDIQQDIEQLGTPVTIDGNPVPTTTKRSASAKIAVRDRETIMLGGFISTSTSKSYSGVPFLKDIPVLGNLFKNVNNSGQRTELIVLMRPTVLPTPEAAAAVATAQKNLLPGVRRAEAEQQKFDDSEMRKADRLLNTNNVSSPTSQYRPVPPAD